MTAAARRSGEIPAPPRHRPGPFESARPAPVRSRGWLWAMVVAAAALGASAQVRVDEKADQLEALKIELEEAKRLRDRIVAKRWEDRRIDMEAREKFNREYDEIKLRVETRNLEADRLHEELQVLLRDAERLEAELEESRSAFLALGGVMLERMQQLASRVDAGFPARVPERLQRLNLLRKSAEINKDSPEEVLEDLLAFERDEIDLTRQVTAQSGSLVLADGSPGHGTLLRLGTVAKAYRDRESGRVGLMLTLPTLSGTRYEWREDIPAQASQALARSLANIADGSDGLTGIPVDVLPNQAHGKSYTQKSETGFWKGLMGDVKTGGVFMWPLLAIPIAGLFLFVRKAAYLSRRRAGNSAVYAEAVRMLEAGDYDEVLRICDRKPGNLILQVVRTVAANRDKSRQQAEKEVQELMLREVPGLERHLTTMSVLGAAAPLLGLLGTVSGLIAMFRAITQFGVNDPKLLAGGIGEALITTETGLIIAVPALLVHNFLANRVDRLVNDMEFHAIRSLNALWPQD